MNKSTLSMSRSNKLPCCKDRAWRGPGAAIVLPAVAARAEAIREIDESFIPTSFSKSFWGLWFEIWRPAPNAVQ